MGDEARGLFKLLDWEEVGSIGVEDFVTGCERFKGTAKGMELALLSFEQRRLMTDFYKFCGTVEHRFDILDKIMLEQRLALAPLSPTWRFSFGSSLLGAVETSIHRLVCPPPTH